MSRMVYFVSYFSIDAAQVGSISEDGSWRVPRLWAFFDILVLTKSLHPASTTIDILDQMSQQIHCFRETVFLLDTLQLTRLV